MTQPGDLRASDAERSEVVDRLSRHGADGRLDPAEFESRLQRAMGAKTRGELEGLFDDLPALPGERLPRRRSHVALSALVVLVVVVSLASASGPLWPGFRAPWLLVAVVGFWLWRRSERHHRRRDAGGSAAPRYDR